MTELENRIALGVVDAASVERDAMTLCKPFAESANTRPEAIWKMLMKLTKEGVLNVWSSGARDVIEESTYEGPAKVRFTKGPEWPLPPDLKTEG